MFIKAIGAGCGAVALLAATPSSAQSLGDLLGEAIGGSLKSRSMKRVCQETATPQAFLADLFAVREKDTTSDGWQDTRDTAALELSQTTTISLEYKGWSGNAYQGQCNFDVTLTLPKQEPTEAEAPALRVPLAGVLEMRETGWVFDHVGDTDASARPIEGHLHAHLSKLVSARATQIEQVRLAEREAQERQAAVERAEWIRTHPEEYAAEQRRNVQLLRLFAKAAAQTEAENRRRQRACQEAGGVWGRRTRNGVPVGMLGCFTR
ncbi:MULTISPECIES: hypothetical protein [Sphingomonas]|uniref:hypothetical protein n=1 Tax=Sphingomonas TaxID=13687 RepID=UPI000F7D6F11|nr:hypothetical protein [Sphingomonas sp. ABOLF]GLK20558.1 hypothetical protein GCM10017606_13840 [Microbacterium terregens]